MKKFLIILAVTTFVCTNAIAQKGNTWVKKYYTVSGNWSIEVENNKTYLKLHEDFKTSKGPDLKLFITKKSAIDVGKKDAVEKYGLLLGDLKSIKGEQKYLIPSNILLTDYKSVVVHCEKYTKVWSAASL